MFLFSIHSSGVTLLIKSRIIQQFRIKCTTPIIAPTLVRQLHTDSWSLGMGTSSMSSNTFGGLTRSFAYSWRRKPLSLQCPKTWHCLF